MAVLGNQRASAGLYGANAGSGSGRKFVTKATLASAGTLNELHGWFVQVPAIVPMTLCVYADAAGSPGALVAASSPISIAVGNADVEINQTGFTTSMPAADYWLGWVDGSTGGGKYYYDASGTCVGILSGAAHNPPSNPFGAPDFGPSARNLAVWAVIGAAGGGGSGSTPAILTCKAGAASVDADDWNALVDAVVALGGSVATRKAGSGAVSTVDYNAVVTAVVALGGNVATRKAGSGQVNTADFNALVDAVKLLGALMAAYQGTYSSIVANVIAKLRLDATADLAGVKEAVNLAYAEVVQSTGCLQRTASSALTADVASYDMPAEVAWIRSVWITYADGMFTDPLQQVTLEQISEQRRATAAAGQQVVRPVYALAGQNQLELWPTPAAGQSLTFTLVYLPDALTDDADVPAIMEPYGSRLLEYGALVELARFKKDPLLPDYEQAYALWMSRFQVWLTRREGSSARTFRIGSTGRVRLADRSADVA